MGNGGQDHGYWGRLEDMTMERPAYKVAAANPGSDLAAEVAAAFTASYLVFKDLGEWTQYLLQNWNKNDALVPRNQAHFHFPFSVNFQIDTTRLTFVFQC